MLVLGSCTLDQNSIENIVFHNEAISLDEKARAHLSRMYKMTEDAAGSPEAMYGINTGFGALAEQRIARKEQEILQRNIILSHAVGVGEPLSFRVAKTMMLLRLNTLVQGYSAPSLALVDNLIKLINNNVVPLVPKKGSVGASGDLAPLAHLGLLLLGIGDCLIDAERHSAKEGLKKAGIEPLHLGVRDGLALINGTQAMAASGIMALIESDRLNLLADIAGAFSFEALSGHSSAFDARIHALKPHPGQIRTAETIRFLTAERTMPELIKNPLTQDPYSIRCMPQVHGASKDVVTHVRTIVENELNAVTDNPLLFLDESHEKLFVLSGGNFHGQSIAMALDYLAMAMAELANISERRMELLLNARHSHGLPAFLADKSGLNSGYMMLQVTAAALINENKVLCHPASVDSIPTSANREDHVSMGMTSANKVWQVIENTRTVLAIELLAAHQALGFRPQGAGKRIQNIHEELDKIIPFRQNDTIFINDLSSMINFIQSEKFQSLIHEIFKIKTTK